MDRLDENQEERADILRALTLLPSKHAEVIALVSEPGADVHAAIASALDCGTAASEHIFDLFRVFRPEVQRRFRAEFDEFRPGAVAD